MNNPIAVLKNKMVKWLRDIEIKDMEEDEQEKYANYESRMTTLTPEGREKYAPVFARFTAGKGTKKEFDKTMISEEWYEFYKNTRKVWSDAIKDKNQNKWIHEGWMEWAETFWRSIEKEEGEDCCRPRR